MSAMIQGRRPQWYERLGEQVMTAYGCLPYHLSKGKAFAPLHAVLEITYRCNLRCEFCFQGHDIKGESDPIDTRGWQEIIDQIPARTIVSLTGGEPTLRRDFCDLASHAFKRHRCHMNTNGTRLAQGDLAEFIANGRFLIVGVSLDGDAATHNTLRNSDDAFEKAWAGIEKLVYYKKKQRRKWPLIDIKTVILPHTLDGVTKLVDLVSTSGVDLITFSFPKVSKLQFNPVLHDSLTPFFEPLAPLAGFEPQGITDYARGWEEKLREKQVAWRYYPRMLSCRQFDNFLAPGPMGDRYLPCYVPWVAMSVTSNGDVYPCLSFRYRNLKDTSLKEIWNGDRAREFRQAIKKNMLLPQCEGCCWLRVRNDRRQGI